MFVRIICDPDEKHYEGVAIGLLYTAVSRATTLGDDDGLNSAIYFTGTAFKRSRIANLNKKTILSRIINCKQIETGGSPIYIGKKRRQ